MSLPYSLIHKSKRNKYAAAPQRSAHHLHNYTYTKLTIKYRLCMFKYGSTVINNIIYNEKSHVVALFKDYLILDDTSEFLKRYYTSYESGVRLPRFFEYYETYSKIYPNYTALLEGKFIYRNIQRKQRMIDLQEQMELETKRNNKMSGARGRFHMKTSKDVSDEVFSTDVYDSIINDRNNEDIEMLFAIKIERANEEDEAFQKHVEKIISDINELEGVSQSVKKQEGTMHVDKSLIEKIEKNLIKSKAKTNNNSINNTNNKSISAYSYNYTNNIKSKISDLKLLYQKNIRNSYVRVNDSNNNNSNIINAQMSYRGNHSIISNENIPIPKSPLTDRIINSNSNHSSLLNNTNNKPHYKSTNSNNIQVSTNHHLGSNNKENTSNNKPTPTPSNVIYIINQNPKFTTHVNVYNTNNAKHRKHVSSASSNTTRQVSGASSMKRILHSAKPHSNPKHVKHVSNSSSVQSSTSHTIYPYQHHSSASNVASALPKRNVSSKSKYSTLNSTTNVKKRNVSNSNNFINSSGSNYYCNMLRTAREIGYKELNMLKSTSSYTKHNSITKYSNLPSKRATAQQSVNTVISRNTSGVVSTKAKNTDRNITNEINSRNKRNGSSDNNKHSSNSSIKHNVISKNDSLTKYGFMDVVNVKKKIVKGIHINNFSKIFNVNVSQLNRTERQSKPK